MKKIIKSSFLDMAIYSSVLFYCTYGIINTAGIEYPLLISFLVIYILNCFTLKKFELINDKIIISYYIRIFFRTKVFEMNDVLYVKYNCASFQTTPYLRIIIKKKDCFFKYKIFYINYFMDNDTKSILQFFKDNGVRVKVVGGYDKNKYIPK